MRDMMNNITPAVAITPAVVTDNTAQVGAIIDRQGYEGVTFAIALGTLVDADATFAVLVEDGDDSGLSDAAAVADTGLVGTETLAGFDFDDDGAARKIGYVGNKRYVRLTITPSANTGAAPMAAVAILGHPHAMPTANPPA